MTIPADIKGVFDVQKIRQQFPILIQKIHGHPLVYFDNAATSQKPFSVIDAFKKYYSEVNANVHRGIYTLSEKATDEYEGSREKVRNFINANSAREIVFTRGTTEAVNLVTNSYGKENINEGDEIIISEMEHHSNLVPWQILAKEKKAVLKFIPVNEKGELVMEEFEKMITGRTKIISVVHVSNSLGTINPVKEIISIAHLHGVPVMIDGAQAAPHLKIDVRDLDCDFYAFSGHKMYGPTGIGVLYAKEHLLENMPPYQSGGEMISSVSYENTTYNDIPYKFEAGTPNIADAIVLSSAIDFIDSIGYENIHEHETELLNYANEKLTEPGGIRFIGTADNKTSVVSFLMDGIHPYDAGTILDQYGIAIRTGFHCTQPLLEQKMKLPGTMRASFSIYNTKDEIDIMIEALKKAKELLG
jgi:cysteine desulfurase/selenocysteine lyase